MGRKRTYRSRSTGSQLKRKDNREKRKSKEIVPSWVKLPYPVLVKVLENLTDTERIQTAQVCQSWNHAFQNPGLWRTRHFEFGGPKANASGHKALAFVRTKGPYLRSVHISCRHITSSTCGNITSTLEPFAACLREVDLHEFHITGLELDCFWKYTQLRETVADSLIELLRNKHNLQVLAISLAQFGLLSGTRLLHIVAQACGTRLSTLLLEDFFHSRLAVFELNEFREALQSFSNLREVSLNYCCVYDDLINLWAESLRGKLSILRIKACDNEPHDHTINDSSWKALTLSCPKLTLDLSIVGIGPAGSVLPILVPHAPLISLQIWSGYDNDVHLQLNDVIHHIANTYWANLQSLHLDFDNYHDDIDDALVHMVAHCRSLKHLQLKAITSTVVANEIYQMVKERQIALTTADITLCSVSDSSMELLRTLREEMGSLAQERGIRLVLRNDLF